MLESRASQLHWNQSCKSEVPLQKWRLFYIYIYNPDLLHLDVVWYYIVCWICTLPYLLLNRHCVLLSVHLSLYLCACQCCLSDKGWDEGKGCRGSVSAFVRQCVTSGMCKYRTGQRLSIIGTKKCWSVLFFLSRCQSDSLSIGLLLADYLT